VFWECFESVLGAFLLPLLCAVFLAESGENFLIFQKPEKENFWKTGTKKNFENRKVCLRESEKGTPCVDLGNGVSWTVAPPLGAGIRRGYSMQKRWKVKIFWARRNISEHRGNRTVRGARRGGPIVTYWYPPWGRWDALTILSHSSCKKEGPTKPLIQTLEVPIHFGCGGFCDRSCSFLGQSRIPRYPSQS